MRFFKSVFFLIFLAAPLTEYAQTPQQLNREGALAEQNRDYFLAIERYKKTLEISPSYIEPLVGLSRCFFALKEYEEALFYIEEAEKLARADSAILNIKGRVLMGLGRYLEGQTLFSQVLSVEPYNVQALFGLAEFELVNNRLKSAAATFEQTLVFSPNNRRALLALSLLHEEMGDAISAENYVKSALYYYYGSAQVQYIAARHYWLGDNLSLARAHAETALAQQDDYLEAVLLLCRIYLRSGEYEAIIEKTQKALLTRQQNYLLHYLTGYAYRQMGEIDLAVRSYTAAFTFYKDDEISRIALENLADKQMPSGDERLLGLAKYRFNLAAEHEKANLASMALQEYRRGLKLAPTDTDGRLGYAKIFKNQGYLAKYLSILEVLKKEEEPPTPVLDEIEYLERYLSDSVARTWGVDQFTVDREQFKIGVYYAKTLLRHYEANQDLADYLEHLLLSYENIAVPLSARPADSLAFAFSQTRESGADYFVIFEMDEGERYFRVGSRFYAARTGALLFEWAIMRTGNQRVKRTLTRLASDINTFLPLVGRVLERRFDQALVNLGRMDGVEVGQEFIVIKNGALAYNNKGLGFQYAEEDVLGSLLINRVDDLVSEGVLTGKDYFDSINPLDNLLPSEQPEVALPITAPLDPGAPGPIDDFYQIFMSIPDYL